MNTERYENGAPERVRVYGGTVTEWRTWSTAAGRDILDQVEIAYSEYENIPGTETEPGRVRLLSRGSEDFSPERLRRDVVRVEVRAWYGGRYPGSGRRIWEVIFSGRVRRSDRAALRRSYRDRERGALAVEVRTV